jgi:SPFH domain / Band 7 family
MPDEPSEADMSGERNAYLDQVVAQQVQLEQDLRSKRSSSPMAAGAPADAAMAKPLPLRPNEPATPPPVQVPSAPGTAPSALDVRLSGFWRWKTVLVPPNAFVVHTRRGRGEPVHLGLGVSFRFNPATDSYLVVPGAMQTVLINAYCICRELQGVLVQAYVQWIIEDFGSAYPKLDFGDPDDPMRLINLQLKEQAEAAIKDKVATMSVHEVLSDKQPIVEELTARLRAVAEGENSDADRGLGLRIVTVQIKEAVVSSKSLWENLQKPFRAEQGRIARLAELDAEEIISARELNTVRAEETQRLENERDLADKRAVNEAAAFDRETQEAARRAQRQEEDARQLADLRQETALQAFALARARDAEELEVGRLRINRESALRQLALEGELTAERARADTAHAGELLHLERERIRAGLDNEQTPEAIQAKLIASLPEIVAKLPKPDELRAVTIGGTQSTTVSGLLAELAAVISALRTTVGRSDVLPG